MTNRADLDQLTSEESTLLAKTGQDMLSKRKGWEVSILYNSKFILMATSLGTNAVVVTRVHCIKVALGNKELKFESQFHRRFIMQKHCCLHDCVCPLSAAQAEHNIPRYKNGLNDTKKKYK